MSLQKARQMIEQKIEQLVDCSHHRCRTVLKVMFSRWIAYSKKEEYRTPDLALPFPVLRDFDALKSGWWSLAKWNRTA